MEDGLRIIAPDRERHRTEIFELIAKAFPHRGYWNRIRDCETGYIAGSTYDWDASRIGILDGKIVTHCGIWEYRLRIGEAVVRFAGVGGIATDGDYLKRGLMSRTIPACLADLPAAGYPASFLFGIENYYHKFGYVAAWPAQKWSVQGTDLPDIPPSFLMEEIREDWTGLSDLYNRENRGRTGTAVRPTFRTNRWPERWIGYRWSLGGRTSGYLVVEDEEDTLEVIDTAGQPEEILTALSHLARSRCKRRVVLEGIPYDGAVARALRRNNAELSLSYRRSGGAMARIEGLNALFRELLPELSARIAASPFRNRDLALRLVLERDREAEQSVVLLSHAGRMEIGDAVEIGGTLRGGNALVRLVLGSDEPDEIVRESEIGLEGAARFLAPVLFPNRRPLLARWDRF